MEKNIKKLTRQLYDHLQTNPTIISIIRFDQSLSLSSPADYFDLFFLVIYKDNKQKQSMFHYIKEDVRIQERWVHRAELEQWIKNGENTNIIQWIIRGEIMYDRDVFLETFRHKLLEFPKSIREQKLLMQFSLFLKRFLQSKEDLSKDNVLDAYSNILRSLHHWARIALIEAGKHPEVTVWEQVRRINPEIYKVYEELTHSTEPIQKRLELVQLACEFSVMSKISTCTNLVRNVLKSKNRGWTINELKNHPLLRDVSSELSLVLNKLVQKSLVTETVMRTTDDRVREIHYRV